METNAGVILLIFGFQNLFRDKDERNENKCKYIKYKNVEG
jgi:hypothetical protein